jgi:AcrR family transcriptional regulator
MGKREQQRARTRQALVDAASRLLNDGEVPTMERLADAARVSRATAYRYFSSVDDVLWQAVTDRSLTPVGSAFGDAGTEPRARVAIAEEIVNGYLFHDPIGARAFERSTLQRWLDDGPEAARRPLRRLAYIDEALAPLAGRVTDDGLQRLRSALALVLGTQAVIVLYDICELDERRAREVTRWAARVLLDAVMAESA